MNVLCFHTLRNESTDRLRPFCDLGQMVLLQTLNLVLEQPVTVSTLALLEH